MKLSDLFAQKKPILSFEVFPPKTGDTYDSVKNAAESIAALKPDFMSVTYGAGGGTSKYTASIAEDIYKKFGVTALAHLTCVNSDKKTVESVLSSLKSKKIENILALRGDIVPGMTFTIEPMINMGTYEVFIDDADGWTVCTDDGLPSAQWENMILITENGNEILTY